MKITFFAMAVLITITFFNLVFLLTDIFHWYALLLVLPMGFIVGYATALLVDIGLKK